MTRPTRSFRRSVLRWLLLLAIPASASDVAIIMDDVGYSLDKGQRAIRLPAPVTLAVMPFTSHAQSLAAQARLAGKEVILHQPLESEQPYRVADGTLTLAMGHSSIQSNFTRALQTVPGIIGINNHTGSRFTQHLDSMNSLMEVVQRHGLFYLDSRTTPNTVAYGVAKRWGVPFIRRDIFLDHDPHPNAIALAFKQALRIAAKQGHAVIIAHPHDNTFEFLERAIPSAQQVQWVKVSELAGKLAAEARAATVAM